MEALVINPRAGKSALISTIGDNECVGFCNLLEKCGITPRYMKEGMSSDDFIINISDVEDINSFDFVFVYNFNVNFFGGVEDKYLMDCYKLMAKRTKPMYYLLVDMGIFFRQLGEKIMDKDWESVKGITYDDLKVGDIHYISQGYDLNLINKVKACKGVVSSNTSYFPLQFSALLNTGRVKEFGEYDSNREYDLYYGGSYRSGRRDAQFKEYFFNKSIKTGFFGSIKLKNFEGDFNSIPDFNGKAKQDGIIEENKRGLATIILSEKLYNNNIVTLRVFESLLADMVVFIDKPLDTNKFIFEDEVLREFNYVASGDELEAKINKLKSDNNLLLDIINRQRSEFKRWFNIDNFVNNLKSILNID